MSKKTFKDDNPALAFISGVRGTPDTHGAHDVQGVSSVHKKGPGDTHGAHDVQEVGRDGERTQGRKGQKLPRINMAFTHDNLDYLRIISRIEGTSMTDYVNQLLEADRQAKRAVVEKAKRILRGIE